MISNTNRPRQRPPATPVQPVKSEQQWQALWISALWSGLWEPNYRTVLKDEDGFSPLGVLVDVVDPTLWAPDLATKSSSGFSGLTPSAVPVRCSLGMDAHLYASLPYRILDMVGLRDSQASFLHPILMLGDRYPSHAKVLISPEMLGEVVGDGNGDKIVTSVHGLAVRGVPYQNIAAFLRSHPWQVFVNERKPI